MTRILLLLTVLLALLAAALGALYWQLPALATRYGPELARDYDVELEVLELERPDLDELHVVRLAGRSGTIRFQARDVTVRYRLDELVDGELEEVSVAELEVLVLEADDAAAGSEAGTDPEALTPAALFAALPAERVAIEALRLEVPAVDFSGHGEALIGATQATLALTGEAPEQAEGLELRGELAVDGGFKLTLRTGEPSTLAPLNVEGQLSAESLELSGALALTGYPLRLVAAMLNAPEFEGRVTITFRSAEPIALAPFEASALALGGTFELDGESPELAVAVRNAAGRWLLRDGAVQTTFSGARVEYADAGTTVDAVMPEGFTVNLEAQRLGFGPGVRARLQTDELTATAVLTDGAVLLTEPLRVESGAAVQAETLGYRIDGGLDIEAELEDSVVSATAEANVGGLEFPLLVTHDLDSGQGNVESTSKLSLAAPLAASLLANWPNDYDLDAGNLAIQATFRWREREPAQGRLLVTVTEGLVRYAEDRLEGVSGTFDVRIDDGDVALLPARVRADRADLGVLLESLKATVALSGDTLEVSDAGAVLLGGRASAEPFSYALSSGSAKLDVTLEALSLAEILALVGDDIRGEGSLSGSLPVVLAADVPSIHGGRVVAEAPGGVIRVAPDFAALTGQPGLDFAIAALTDYRFETLETSVDYTEDGELTLGVSLEGVNPEVEKGRPIHYNLNITQNVLVLLQSLRAQRVVTERLEERVLN